MNQHDPERRSWRSGGFATLAAATAVISVVAGTLILTLVVLSAVVGYGCLMSSDALKAQRREAERKASDPEGYRREQEKWRTVPSSIPGVEEKVRVVS